MKNIIKVNAILTNVTSENTLTVNGIFQEGHRMTVWYVEKKPKINDPIFQCFLINNSHGNIDGRNNM